MAAFLHTGVYHQPSCVPANAAMATISIMTVVFAFMPPAPRNRRQKTMLKNTHRRYKYNDREEDPILMPSPVSVSVTPVECTGLINGEKA